MEIYILIILIVIVLILAAKSMIKYRKTCEGLDDNNVKYYVIQMSSKPERVENVNIQEQKLGKKINRFEAILGKDHGEKYKHLIDDYKDKPRYESSMAHIRNYGELGCYLSHMELIKQIMENENENGYSVIFEDDFNLIDNECDININHYIDVLKMNNRDFDLLFLGHCFRNNNPLYKDNIYEITNLKDDIVVLCTHGYIINNKHIEKIYNNITIPNYSIDNQYNQMIKNKICKGYLIDPPIVTQQSNVISSTIDGHT